MFYWKFLLCMVYRCVWTLHTQSGIYKEFCQGGPLLFLVNFFFHQNGGSDSVMQGLLFLEVLDLKTSSYFLQALPPPF